MKETFETRDIARELARKYSTMTHEELDTLESILVPMKFAKGEMILKEGEVCENIYYIEHGLVRQFYFKNGKQITEHLGEDRTIFMCIESLFREEATKLQVEAIEPTTVYALPKQRLEQVALHNVNIQILYRKILEESLIISQVHADLVRFETAQDRYKKMCKSASYIACTISLYCQLFTNDTRNPQSCSCSYIVRIVYSSKEL